MIDLIKNWLLHSGIQNTDSNAVLQGSFNSWYNFNSKEYPFIYSEITGYGTTTLLYLYKLDQNSILLERAKLAGNWIIKIAMHPCGGVRTKDYYDKEKKDFASFKNEIIYMFDTGMALYSLVNLYHFTSDENYLVNAKRIADFLMSMQKSQKSDGFYAIYDAKENKPLNLEGKWSTSSGSYHAKLSLGLLEASKLLKESIYRKSAIKICNRALEFQKTNGRFLTYENDTNLHPHFYTAEGLFYAGLTLNKNKFIESAVRSVIWVLDNQLSNGGIPSSYSNDKFDENERTDVLAQTLRLGILALQHEKLDKSYEEKLIKLKNRLLEFQNSSIVHKGGFFYGFENGKKINHINSWCSMFALQALNFYDLFFNKRKEITMDLFV